MRPLVLLGLLALPSLAAAQVAGDDVVVAAVRGPAVVLVDQPFKVEADIANRGDAAKNVQLYSFLYRVEEGKRCGGHLDSRFLGGVDRAARPTLRLPPRTTVTYPAEGALPWWHTVNRSQVGPGGTFEMCTFAYAADASGRLVPYEPFSQRLVVRGDNGLPSADFVWSPARGNVTTEFRFRALVGEDPEGDPLSYEWEFGHLGTSGKARAEGPVATHVFYHFSPFPRTYLVNLTVRDGFESVVVRKEVVVEPEGTAAPQRWEEDPVARPWWRAIPAPAALGALGVLAAAALRRR